MHFYFFFLVELAMIMDRLYGGVCYAGIDTDPELKYPKGAGRVAFSNQQSYIAAISARFVQLQHGEIDKRVRILNNTLAHLCKYFSGFFNFCICLYFGAKIQIDLFQFIYLLFSAKIQIKFFQNSNVYFFGAKIQIDLKLYLKCHIILALKFKMTISTHRCKFLLYISGFSISKKIIRTFFFFSKT